MPPKPKAQEHEQRPDERSHDVSQRYRHPVEFRKKPERAKQEAAHKSAEETKAQILDRSESLAVAFDDQPCKASAN